MKIRTLKKNNKHLLSKRGKGFYGRVFVLGIDDRFIVLQNARKGPKTTAVLTYCDADLFERANEKELVIDAVQRHYLKKYGTELLLIKSFVSLHKFTENGKVFELSLSPISKQTTIFDEKGRNTVVAEVVQGQEGLVAVGAGRKVRAVKAGDMRHRDGQEAPVEEHTGSHL